MVKSKKLACDSLSLFTTFIVGAFGFVAALAWNSAIQDLIGKLNFDSFGSFFYALIVTVIAVIAILVLNRSKRKVCK